MRQLAWAFYIGCTTVLLTFACTDPTEIGADLLEGDEAVVGFTDTLSVTAQTIGIDTILTYFPVSDPAQASTGYLVGDMQDPIFGPTKSQIFAQVAPVVNPDFSNTKLDSIVLVLPYDTLGYYGNLKETYGLSVHRLTDYINPDKNYYSNAAFASQASPLGSKEFVPSFDSLTIFNYTSGSLKADTVKVPAQLRISLTRALGEEFLKKDSATFARDSVFSQLFKGLHIKPTTKNQGIMSFNLSNSRAGIFMYYTKNDTIKTQMQFSFDAFLARTTKFEHNYSNAFVKPYINNPTRSDSLVFVQGMAGVITRLEVPYVDKLQGVIVNKAELELRVATPPGDDPSIFTPAPLLLLSYADANGNLIAINDFVLFTRINRLEFYGGSPQNGNAGEPKFYKINLTTHFQEMVNKKRGTALYLTVFDRAQQPERVVLYGAKNPQYGIKLKVAYTKL